MKDIALSGDMAIVMSGQVLWSKSASLYTVFEFFNIHGGTTMDIQYSYLK